MAKQLCNPNFCLLAQKRGSLIRHMLILHFYLLNIFSHEARTFSHSRAVFNQTLSPTTPPNRVEYNRGLLVRVYWYTPETRIHNGQYILVLHTTSRKKTWDITTTVHHHLCTVEKAHVLRALLLFSCNGLINCRVVVALVSTVKQDKELVVYL